MIFEMLHSFCVVAKTDRGSDRISDGSSIYLYWGGSGLTNRTKCLLVDFVLSEFHFKVKMSSLFHHSVGKVLFLC